MPGLDGATPLEELRAFAEACTACALYEHATQTVFGEGPPDASLMLMGEQPGDQEDRQGHPFVGPAGGVLDRALDQAAIDRGSVYLTNAVKHFKWEPRGKVRLHKKPNVSEMAACRQWWEAELEAVRPKVLGCLGATAAQAVFGADFRVTKQRGQWFELPSGVAAIATIHPSAVLRAEDELRDEFFDGLVRDLALMATRLD
ncbi:MAG: uracil-DNA glycosylase [Actinomycetia bacterium]|nr:uracil-DNA glycosylase [Actinomycetes bacterium]